MAGPDVPGTIDMNCPLISIGMPVYNSDRFIEDAITSVLHQTFQNFELIITDDGSTDDSAKIIESFTDKRIKFLRGEVNLGISSRINHQVNIASGGFFVRMDADDIMFPSRIEEQFSFFKR
nr:glycosyltransferase family 2 protein [Desulfobacula sp.]